MTALSIGEGRLQTLLLVLPCDRLDRLNSCLNHGRGLKRIVLLVLLIVSVGYLGKEDNHAIC